MIHERALREGEADRLLGEGAPIGRNGVRS